MSVIESDYNVSCRNTIGVRLEKMYGDKLNELKCNHEYVKGVALTSDCLIR